MYQNISIPIYLLEMSSEVPMSGANPCTMAALYAREKVEMRIME